MPLFAGLEDRDLDRLAGLMAQRTYTPQENVLYEGRVGALLFFVITDGRAAVHVAESHRRDLGPGDWFGEMALLEQAPRSATVRAVTELQCHVLTAWEFRNFVESHPDVAWRIMQSLAGRIREAETTSG